MNDYDRIARVIRFLDEHHTEQPDLAALAECAGLSSSHFHRLFSRWAGITPKDFLQCLTLTHVKNCLRNGQSVLDAALDAGLSGPSRLHDLCVTLEAATPGEVKLGGANWTIQAGFAECPFGICLVALSERGICHLSFEETADRSAGEATILVGWPRAKIEWNNAIASQLVAGQFRREPGDPHRPALRAIVRGSSFQVRVWRALLQVPAGSLVSYADLATVVGDRNAARAVGHAVAQNSLAYLIPCHRVIRSTGIMGDYRWGATRKAAIIAWESSHHVEDNADRSSTRGSAPKQKESSR